MPEIQTKTEEQPVEIDYVQLDDIIDREFDGDKENLIMILQSIQKQYNYLPRPALDYLSVKIGAPLSKIYGVATFYSTFSLEPRGKHIVSICLGTACHVRGAERVHERLENTLGIQDGQTTEDGCFTLESVRCVGCCSLGPVVKIDEDVHGRIDSSEVKKIIGRYE
jgi:NADH:ubiquinone oxidoreductase subunit E